MSKLEEYEALLKRSDGFLETALMQARAGMYDLAVFSLEQSLQLFLKATLLRVGSDYPRTHSIRRLLELLTEATGRSELRELASRYSVELGALEDAYISSRYIPRIYTKDEFERLRAVVEEVRSNVERSVR
ncbi:MAG: HEPN domain-containing protein [Candidatus Caldarchaeales archaeon]|jgi:HEPN domain-containing protein